jgi:UTRA domain
LKSGYVGPVLPSRFPYQGIVDDLRASILRGRLAGGERLAVGERARRALPDESSDRAAGDCAAEGRGPGQHGAAPWCVSSGQSRIWRLLLSGENLRRHRRAGGSGFNAQVEEQGQTPEQRLLEVGWVKAPREVALRLDVDDEARVVVRRRPFVVNRGPVAFGDNSYPPDVADAAGGARADRRRSVRADRGSRRSDWPAAEALLRRPRVRDADAGVGRGAEGRPRDPRGPHAMNGL